jgi:nitrogen fixation NifU-like protein
MTDDPRALYQAQILEHSKNPRHEGPLEGATHEATKINPLCGDRITLRLTVRDGRIEEAKFEARGCAIAIASASMLTEIVAGSSPAEASSHAARLMALVKEGAEPQPTDGDLTVLAGVRSFPSRKRCATLAWEALTEAVGGH